MDLLDAKLDDMYRIFVDSENYIFTRPTMNTMLATVIAIKKPEYNSKMLILGWKPNQPRPPNAALRSSTSIENNYSANEKLYTYGLSVAMATTVAIKILNGVDGFPCRKCMNFYPYAVPNQKDGTLLCWSCRTY